MGAGAMTRRFDQAVTTPALDERAARALLRGVRPSDVANLYGVNLRTAYRWRRDLVAVESVRVDGWVATFARRRDKPPVRITEWAVETRWKELGDKPLSKRESVSDNRCVEQPNTGDRP